MTEILSIDPGMSTGIVHAEFSKQEPMKVLGRWQVEGGLPKFMDWVFDEFQASFFGLEIVCEKFSPLPRVFRLRELEPLRIEGFVSGLVRSLPGTMGLTWQAPGAMNIAGTYGTYAENFKAANNLLRDLGLWITPKQIGCKDANDVNAASKHLIAYLRGVGHQPTLDMITSV